MGPTFIKIIDKAQDLEVLVNVNAITEIHVEYYMTSPGDQDKKFATKNAAARTNPDAIRIYHIIVGGTKHTIAEDPGSPVMQVLAEIYKNAITNDR